MSRDLCCLAISNNLCVRSTHLAEGIKSSLSFVLLGNPKDSIQKNDNQN